MKGLSMERKSKVYLKTCTEGREGRRGGGRHWLGSEDQNGLEWISTAFKKQHATYQPKKSSKCENARLR